MISTCTWIVWERMHWNCCSVTGKQVHKSIDYDARIQSNFVKLEFRQMYIFVPNNKCTWKDSKTLEICMTHNIWSMKLSNLKCYTREIPIMSTWFLSIKCLHLYFPGGYCCASRGNSPRRTHWRSGSRAGHTTRPTTSISLSVWPLSVSMATTWLIRACPPMKYSCTSAVLPCIWMGSLFYER